MAKKTTKKKATRKTTKKPTARRGLFEPRTKAEWLVQQFDLDNPEFPLDAEIIGACPDELPGKLPRTAKQFTAAVIGEFE